MTMNQIFPVSSHHAVFGWLNSNLSFSFADYHDPKTTSFGLMRDLNGDFILSLRGLAIHLYQNRKVVSIVLRGQLELKKAS